LFSSAALRGEFGSIASIASGLRRQIQKDVLDQ
jgi:hypothetical protein